MRRMSKLRREIVHEAIQGRLPAQVVVDQYLLALDVFERDHAAWLRSKQAGLDALAAEDRAMVAAGR